MRAKVHKENQGADTQSAPWFALAFESAPLLVQDRCDGAGVVVPESPAMEPHKPPSTAPTAKATGMSATGEVPGGFAAGFMLAMTMATSPPASPRPAPITIPRA